MNTLLHSLTEMKILTSDELQKELNRRSDWVASWVVEPELNPTNTIYRISTTGYARVIELPRNVNILRTVAFVIRDAKARLGYPPVFPDMEDVLMYDYQHTAERLRNLERQMQEEL